MTKPELAFTHRFVPAKPGGPSITLLLLHGTGGDENSLLPLGNAIAPGAAVLSPRGKVLEYGMPRFFRRLGEGVFDLEDLKLRAHELADFVGAAAGHYGFDPRRVVAAGFSNGANMATSLLLLRPETLAAAVLLRPMVPLVPDPPPDLAGKRVLILGGEIDTVVPREQPLRLARILAEAGAKVTLDWTTGGHSLETEDLAAAERWLAR